MVFTCVSLWESKCFSIARKDFTLLVTEGKNVCLVQEVHCAHRAVKKKSEKLCITEIAPNGPMVLVTLIRMYFVRHTSMYDIIGWANTECSTVQLFLHL